MTDAYETAAQALLAEPGVEAGTMMKTPCLRYRGDFLGMLFEREDALIVKLAPERVQALVAGGQGNWFKFTGKTFREWLLVPRDLESEYEGFLREALAYAISRRNQTSTKTKRK